MHAIDNTTASYLSWKENAEVTMCQYFRCIFSDHEIFQEISWIGFICILSIPVLIKIMYKHLRRDVSLFGLRSWLSQIGQWFHHSPSPWWVYWGGIPYQPLTCCSLIVCGTALSFCVGLLSDDPCDPQTENTNLDKPDRKCHPILVLAG